MPLEIHELARPLDRQHLATELEDKLGMEVSISDGNGWEQVRIGPFESEALAKDAFHQLVSCLAAICVQTQYPIFFGAVRIE